MRDIEGRAITTEQKDASTAGITTTEKHDKPIRTLVVDDHPVVRYGLITLLEQRPDIDVVGEAGSCKECCDSVSALRPDVVILDLEMDDSHDCDALMCVRSTHPETRIIVFTSYDEPWRVDGVIRLGAQGYLVKGTSATHIFEAIQVVNQGGSFLDPAVVPTLLNNGAFRKNSHELGNHSFSEREKAVLELVAEGRRNKEIAKRLNITERTVKFHISGLFTKLNAGNRTEAVRIASQHGLLSIRSPVGRPVDEINLN